MNTYKITFTVSIGESTQDFEEVVRYAGTRKELLQKYNHYLETIGYMSFTTPERTERVFKREDILSFYISLEDYEAKSSRILY